MAAMTRTSTGRDLPPPTRWTARSWRARRSLTWSRRGHLADLVQEERPAVGLLEAAGARALGSGEGTGLVAEELALDQAFGDRAAVDGYELLGAPARLGVDGAGGDLLAGPALAEEEHGDLVPGGALQEAHCPPDRGRLALDRREAFAVEFAAEGRDAGPQATLGLGVPDRGHEAGPVEGLDDEVHGPEAHALHGVVEGLAGREDQDREVG